VGIGVIGLMMVLVANRLLVRFVGLSGPTLIAAAFATSLGTTTALIAASVALRALLKVTIPIKTLARAIVASAVAFYTARLLPQSSPLLAPVVMTAAGLVYLAVLAALGEFKKADVDAVMSAIERRKKAA
jgi:O-antigen/teichoic acid export membrane protein